MHIEFVKGNINILSEHSGGSYNNNLLFIVLKNDYQAHSISAPNNLISPFKSRKSTGEIYFQYLQAYWGPRAFFPHFYMQWKCDSCHKCQKKVVGKNGSSGQPTCTSTLLILWSLNILFLTFLNCDFWSDCALFNSSF